MFGMICGSPPVLACITPFFSSAQAYIWVLLWLLLFFFLVPQSSQNEVCLLHTWEEFRGIQMSIELIQLSPYWSVQYVCIFQSIYQKKDKIFHFPHLLLGLFEAGVLVTMAWLAVKYFSLCMLWWFILYRYISVLLHNVQWLCLSLFSASLPSSLFFFPSFSSSLPLCHSCSHSPCSPSPLLLPLLLSQFQSYCSICKIQNDECRI